MTRRKKTDGERIAEKTARSPHEKWGMVFAANLAAEIDRLVRRRMAEAGEEIKRQRAENARLRAQVAEYFAEPETHAVEREE